MEGGENLDKITQIEGAIRKQRGSVRVNYWGVKGTSVTMQW